MRINTNVVSLNTQNLLRKNNQDLETRMSRLSSGKRLTSAADDAAGVAIATRMDSKIRGMEVGVRNSNDGVSLLQTAESALGSITSILQRMRDLAVQSANETNTTADRTALDGEFQQLKTEINHIAANTTFNGTNLLNAAAALDIQLSDVSGDIMTINTIDATAATLTLAGNVLGADATAATTALGQIDAALTTVSTARATFGANLNRLNFNVDNINSSKINLATAKSRIEDADMAVEVSEMTKSKILVQSGMSMLSQSNQNPQMILNLLQQ